MLIWVKHKHKLEQCEKITVKKRRTKNEKKIFFPYVDEKKSLESGKLEQEKSKIAFF